ncbi:class II fumarate hydratase [Dermatobacter hominis]|uniref:class II fumarate hydratase n=1 Tax=Dermatobacter hominis TaxID=2884263 RepID=UPI001D1304E7|nr:class II fumarate hydratase [Dermatobacter hominis]UDY34330.1 class II fumarate hydratase [Dermatobacter hominis]
MSTDQTATTDGFRVEHDSLGEVRVPTDARWQAQTQRAVENFPVSGTTVAPSLVRALVEIKRAAAQINARRGHVDTGITDAIVAAADEVLGGAHDDQFPVDVFQTGSGTSTNMNVNEVLSTVASGGGLDVHPNDHVNAGQSSNDTFPSAIRIAAADGVVHRLIPALEHLARSLRGAAERFDDVVKAGRTHLMDAVPVTLGQEFGGYATAIELGIDRLRGMLPRLGHLPLGGTAVGTGLNAPEGFAAEVIELVAQRTGLDLVEATDHFEAQGAQDVLVEASGACRVVAVSLNKLASDLRWMSSGPSAGLAEIHLPDLQPGSSIMPGKVNPVLPEATQQVVAQVIGNDAAVAFAGASGNFELNVMLPVMGRNLLESIELLANVSVLLADRCIDGITADAERSRRYAESSSAIVTALVPLIGYEQAAVVAKAAVASGRTIREEVVDRGLVDDVEALDRALDVLAMTRGGRRTD